jgi:hydroxymethylglutaryl-CoA lyase
MAGLPRKITISEVGPRDGLQIEKQPVATATKIALIDKLVATGIDRIEVSAFVHPKIVPQMADAEQVFAGIQRKPGVRYAALVPNAKGAERAIAASADDLKIGVAASETFNGLNFRMSTEEGARALSEIASMARGTKSKLAGVVGTAFGCPYEGAVSEAKVEQLFGHMVELGCDVIYLADTTGVGNPAQVSRTLEALRRRWPNQRIGLHLHNTRGLGLANALAGLENGVTDFESSIGGLGGCPYAPRAVGNISTEDFVHMLHAMDIDTGIDLDALIGVARYAQDALDRPLPGMVMKAGKANELHDKNAPRTKLD